MRVCARVQWILRLLKKVEDEGLARLAVSILLCLSFALRARWLLRPIMSIWLRCASFLLCLAGYLFRLVLFLFLPSALLRPHVRLAQV